MDVGVLNMTEKVELILIAFIRQLYTFYCNK